MVEPIPEAYPRVTPYLVVDGAADAIDFYSNVFGFSERGGRMLNPDGKVGHTELQLGDSLVMLADEHPQLGIMGPRSIGGTPVSLHVYVEDVDAMFDQAIQGGASVLRPVEDQFYGDRMGTLEDPWGHRWTIGSHIEDVPPDEMAKRAAEAAAQMGG